MSAWTRMAGWLRGDAGQRAANFSPSLEDALNSRVYGPGGAGIMVNPDTAMRKVAIGATVRLISNTGRTMPVHAFRGTGGDAMELDDPAVLRDPDGTGRGIGDFISQALWSLATRGNLMVHILTLNRDGKPDTIQVLHPDRITPHIDGDGKLWWRPERGPMIPGDRVDHTRMYPVPGCVLGNSPIEEHAATVGVSIAAEKFGADYFENGGHPTGLLSSADPLTQAQADIVKAKFRIATSSREPVLLPSGIDYKQIQITPNESQFLDAQQFSAAECARIFGPGFAEVLGYETGGSLTYANAVDSDVKLLKYSLDPFLVPIEQMLTRMLTRSTYVKLNRNALLRTNPIDRWRVYEIASRVGAFTPNTILGFEDMPDVAWGAVPYVSKSAPAAGNASSSDESAPAQNGAGQ